MSLDPQDVRHQDPDIINKLVEDLTHGTRKPKPKTDFSCKRTTFELENGLKVSSWKIPDFDYKKRSDLPTHARGLFTHKREDGTEEIVIRGYDKFFNINEVHQTKWDWIMKNTKGPYELTLKENGCIIFISGLPGGHLLVCSKHSTGARGDVELSHAKAGEKWVDRQLATLGKTRKELAEYLRNMNITAVAELCDDSFEEHILDYEGDRAGLYIHGVNYNLPDFHTFDMSEVCSKFTDVWGFKKIDYVMKDNVPDLKAFLEKAAKTGSWEGRSTEGFVIRCKARKGPNDPDWSDWFFKYKFEEPYLMFRQWRECTKSLISGSAPKFRKHQKITRQYLDFAAKYFSQHPGAAKQYQLNHGIIALRNAFLESRGLKGSGDVRRVQESEEADEEAETTKGNNVILVPIATIGVGKTTVALALVKLFKWGHQQNDNIVAAKGKPALFARSCTMALAGAPVVIADRNNHLKREREQLITDISNSIPNATFVALHFVHNNGVDKKLMDKIRRTARERVFTRGDNHQTIQAASKERAEIEGIIDGFITRFQPCNPEKSPDDAFDKVIDLDPTTGSRKNLEKVVRELHEAYPDLVPELPTAEQLDEAIDSALSYNPDIKHEIKSQNRREKKDTRQQKNKGPGPQNKKAVEYYSISLPTNTILDLLKRTFKENAPKDAFFRKLQESGRVQDKFHVTLIHRANSKQHSEVWEEYNKAWIDSSQQQTLGLQKIKLKSLVWDGRCMAIACEIPDGGRKCTNEIPHITIGTANSTIKPRESNDMLVGKWKGGMGVDEVELDGMEVEGEVMAVLPMGR